MVVGGVDDVQILLFITDALSSSNVMIGAARFDDTDFRSVLALIVGTAMIISLLCRGDTDSATGAIFNSGQSTVTANRIDPRPNQIKKQLFFIHSKVEKKNKL